jgi:hypothetical protein
MPMGRARGLHLKEKFIAFQPGRSMRSPELGRRPFETGAVAQERARFIDSRIRSGGAGNRTRVLR